MNIQDAILYGLMMFGPDCWYRYGARLQPEMFDGECREIYSTIAKLNRAGQASDQVCVYESLKNLSPEAGEKVTAIFRAPEFISQASMPSYVTHLTEAYRTRKAQDIGAMLAETGDKETALADLMAMESESHRATIAGADAEKLLVDTLESTAEGIKTGLADLDGLLGGIEPADLFIIAARPRIGKTALLLNILDGQDVPVLMFSLEMSAAQLMKRRVSAKGFDYKKLRNHRSMPEFEQNRLRKAIKELKQNFWINDTAALPIGELESEAVRMVKTHGVKIIAVDYLQLVTCRAENRLEEVSEVSRRLKKIAKRCNVAVIALCQLNRAIETRGGKSGPKLSDLRESGQIEQDADQIIFVDRPEVHVPNIKPGMAEIVVAKNRSGNTGDIEVCWQGHYQRFTNYSPNPYVRSA
jgi:replicative DNA helicase